MLTGSTAIPLWSEEIYPHLEREILKALRFNTDLISCSQLVYELLVTYCSLESTQHKGIDTVLSQAQFRSYLCIIGKSLKGYVTQIKFALMHT